MATLLPNARFFSLCSFTYSGCPFLYSFSRPSLTVSSEKSVWASILLPRWRRECGISFASRRRSRTTSTSAAIFSEEETEDWEDDEEEEEEEEEEGEDMPLREMMQWLKNKPAGFGEGMRYDTKVEDKLLEEIKQNKKDQLEGNSIPRASKKENAGSVKKQENLMVTEVIKTDPEVRVWNLPKKKNIDRDLWKAFKGFPGIISINPAVTGNKKTRDPICRGFAFVGFESDDAAYGFVRKYSKQNLLFGKVQKQISCDVINVPGVLNSSESSKSCSYASPNKSEYRHSENELFVSNASEISKNNNGIEPNNEEFTMLSNDTNISSSNNENEENEDLQFNTPTLAYQNRKKNDKLDRTKPPKPSKGHILGSLAKLKIKDRAILTGVFSKYGEVASAASKKI